MEAVSTTLSYVKWIPSAERARREIPPRIRGPEEARGPGGQARRLQPFQEAALTVRRGGRVVVLADEDDPPMPQPGEMSHDVVGGPDIVRAHPGHALQLLVAAQVYDREAVLDQPLELRAGGVAGR